MIRSFFKRSFQRNVGVRALLTIDRGRCSAHHTWRPAGVRVGYHITLSTTGIRGSAAVAQRSQKKKASNNEIPMEHILNALETSLESLALHQGQIGESLLALLQKELDTLMASASKQQPEPATEDFPEANIDPAHLWVSLQKNPDGGLSGDVVRTVLKHAIRLFEDSDKSVFIEVHLPELGRSLNLPSSLNNQMALEKFEQPKIVLVGDTHGQLNDVLWLFRQHGPPSACTTYLFNGDIADRGKDAVEIFTLLLAFKIKYPNRVYVLRGNHEHSAMNNMSKQMGGGFAQECDSKHGHWLFDRFTQLFQLLPLFAMIENQVLVVHGGLPREEGVLLEHLRNIRVPISHYPSPRTKKDIDNGVQLTWTPQDTIIFDSQWADPHEGKGIKNSRRGSDAITFGEDVTKRFLTNNNLELCIRSHELPPRFENQKAGRGPGYRWSHDDRLLTVFSASNYGGIGKNNGAVAIFRFGRTRETEDDKYRQIGDLVLEVKEHYAPSNMKDVARRLATATATHAESVSKVLESVQHDISEIRPSSQTQDDSMGPALLSTEFVPEGLLQYTLSIICAHRETLWNFCREHGTDGLVPTKLLEGELARLCHGPGEDLPWGWLLDNVLGSGTGSSEMWEYEPVLSRYQIQWKALEKKRNTGESSKQLREIMSKVLFAELTFSEAKGLFDKNLDGQIDEDECEGVLSRLLPALSKRQVNFVLETLQSAWGGSKIVSAERFLVTLQLHFAFREPPEDPALRDTLKVLVSKMISNFSLEKEYSAQHLVPAGLELLDVFIAWEQEGNGFISREELLAGLEQIVDLGDLGEDSIDSMWQFLDETQNGDINVFEFLRGFAAVIPDANASSSSLASSELADDMFSGLCALLLAHRPVLLRGCRALDRRVKMGGTLPRESFLAVVRALLDSLPDSYHSESWPYEVQLNELRRALSTDVKYDEVLAQLEIVDTSRGSARSGGETKTRTDVSNKKATM